MTTFLFDKTIFGPIKSRRLGASLGVNLLPNTSKVCNFNCIYCECGWTTDLKSSKALPSAEEVKDLLEKKLQEMKQNKRHLDVITFAGNGEPTMHPSFSEIIDNTIALRDKYFPGIKVAVLSNSTLVHKKEVFDALEKVDLNILKIDSAFEDTCRLMNKPLGHFNLNSIIENLKDFRSNLVIQTMFIKGNLEGVLLDNTTEKEVSAWIEVIEKIRPSQVMIYTIARATPANGLEKIGRKKLSEIASRVKLLGIPVSVSE
jgi:wyosine [tRNA(Phe)-imidazoG37] synthetase (radical SAM superfamily)